MFFYLIAWPQQFLFSESHANLALKSLIVPVSCHNQNGSCVHEKNGGPVSTLRGFCQLFGVFLTLYHQFRWEYWDLSALHTAVSCKDTSSVFKSFSTELVFRHLYCHSSMDNLALLSSVV